MEITLHIKNTENIANLSATDIRQAEQIVEALLVTGSMSGVRGGQVIIHFDADGMFQKVQHSYFPWVRRNVDRK